MGLDAQFLAVHVFAYGNILHLGRYDASLGVSHLRDVFASLCTSWQLYMLKAQLVERVVGKSQLSVFACYLSKLFRIVAVQDPLLAYAWQTFLEVNLDVRVAVRTACVVDINRLVRSHVWQSLLVANYGGSEVNLSHSYFDFREELALHIRLFSLGVGFIVLWHNYDMSLKIGC